MVAMNLYIGSSNLNCIWESLTQYLHLRTDLILSFGICRFQAGRSKRKKTSLKDQEAGGSKKKKTSLKDQEAGSSKKN